MTNEADLAQYYDQEAGERAVRPIDPRRVALCEAFIARLVGEGLTTVLEVGTGPGRDAAAFQSANRRVFGVDLSEAHVRRATTYVAGAAVASVLALPFRSAACDAGWTMSTLVHVSNELFDQAMGEICRVVCQRGLLAIGLWGAPTDTEGVHDEDTILPKRFFSRRTDEHLRAMLKPYGKVEQFEAWPHRQNAAWTYQFVVLRVAS